MTITLHENDLPENLEFSGSIAVDTEALGLQNKRDRLCLVQLSSGDGTAHLVQLHKDNYDAPNLKALLADPNITKIFHFARFDVAIIQQYLGIQCDPVYCTRIASYIARTYTDRHGLRDLCKELINVEISKQQQSSYWGAKQLSEEQKLYAANDVLYLHKLKEKLDEILDREGRKELAYDCFKFINTRVKLDLNGWQDKDIFAH